VLCLLKFKDISYQKVTWEPLEDVEMDITSKELLKKYIKNREKDKKPMYHDEDVEITEIVDKSFTEMERIITTKSEDVFDEEQGDIINTEMYYVKWRGLNYLENTWEYIEDIDEKLLQIMLTTKKKS
jgi:hypothetical protein